jgi:predicted nucleic acid-binding protein
MVYLDTSVTVPLFVAEPSSDQVDRWFAACDVPVVSSDWIITEFASALSLKERSGTLAAKDAKAAWRSFESFVQSGLRLIPVSRHTFAAAAKMTREPAHGLRAGDALHLAAALEMGAQTVATLDAVMTANAKRLKMKVVVFS